MTTLLRLPDGRPVTVTTARGEMTAMLYGEPLSEETAVLAVDGSPVVRLSNLHRLQRVFRDATTWPRTQHVGPRVSYINEASDEEFQWLVEEIAEQFGISPTKPFRQLSAFTRSELGFQDPPERVAEKRCVACEKPMTSLDDTIIFCSTPIHGSCGTDMASEFDEAWGCTDDLLGNSL